MAEIHLSNVTRLYHRSSLPNSAARRMEETEQAQSGPLAALDGITLTVPDGKTCAVIGPSGCGKSTLLRVIAGLDMEYTGTVAYDGKDVRDVPPGERNIGMVFQNYALYPHFHGGGNLLFFFRVRKAPDAEAEERIRITSEIMGYGFDQLLPHRPGTLSGGEQQRLAIARALVRDPDLFLFDEPLSNLDAKLRMQTRVEIKRLLNRFAITALYVTHDQEEAMALGDLIAVMRAGRIEQVGTYQELHDQPANAFVAGFLGRYPMNLMHGVVTAHGALHLAGTDIPLPPAIRAQAQPDRSLTVGVWPEALRLAEGTSAATHERHLDGSVETIEPDFVRRTQYVRVQTEAGLVTVADTTNRLLASGEHVAVVLPIDQLYYFDADNDRRLQVEVN